MSTTPDNSPHEYAIHIEGIGDDEDTQQFGNLYTTGDTYSGSTNGVVDWRSPDWDKSFTNPATVKDDILIPDSLSGVGDSINTYDSSIQWAGFDFDLKATPEILETFLNKARRPNFKLNESIDANNVTIKTNANNGEIKESVVFIGDEALDVNTHKGSGEYGVTRGAFLSVPQQHGSGDSIFKQVPYWQNRKVRFFSYQPYPKSGESYIKLIRRYVGVIDGAISHNNTRLTIPTVSAGQKLRNRQSNLDPITTLDLNAKEESFSVRVQEDAFEGSSSPIDLKEVKGDFDLSSGKESSVIKPNKWNNGDERTWIQLQDSLILPYDGHKIHWFTENSGNGPFNVTLSSNTDAPFGQQDFDNVPDRIVEVNELFVIARRYDEEHSKTYSSTRFITESSNHDEKYIYHPVSVAACLLMSTYGENVDAEKFDVLNGNMGLSALSLFNNDPTASGGFIEEIRSLVDEHPEDQIDHLVLGWNGEKVDLWDRITSMLNSFNYYWKVEQNGRIGIKKLSTSDIGFNDEALNNKVTAVPSDSISQNDGEDKSIDVIEAKVGNIPTEDRPKLIQVQSLGDNPNRSTQLSKSPDKTVNMETISISNAGLAESLLKKSAILQNLGSPRINIQVKDHLDDDNSPDYTVGKPCVISRLPLRKKWGVDRSGKLTRFDNSSTSFVSIIIGRTFLPQKRSYKLKIQLISEGVARWRSPSGLIESVDSANNTVTLSNVEQYQGASVFQVDDDVQFFNKEGVEVTSEVKEITNVDTTNDKITLNDFSFTTDPSAGDIVEIANLDVDLGDDGGYLHKDRAGSTDRPYVGLAESDETLGDSEDEADVYG